MTTTPLTEQQLAHWKRRALQAEAVVHFALWMRPLGPHWSGREPETADQLCTRLRAHVEDRYPEQITRYAHQRIEVLELAELCGCPEDADDWEEFHGESGENGHTLCSKKVLGHVCDSCKDEEGEGPAWLPYAVAWPCPPIAALDQPAAPAPTSAPLAASHGPAGDRDSETGAEGVAGREGESGADIDADPGWCTFGEDDAPGAGCILPAGHQPPNRHLVVPGDTDDGN